MSGASLDRMSTNEKTLPGTSQPVHNQACCLTHKPTPIRGVRNSKEMTERYEFILGMSNLKRTERGKTPGIELHNMRGEM